MAWEIKLKKRFEIKRIIRKLKCSIMVNAGEVADGLFVVGVSAFSVGIAGVAASYCRIAEEAYFIWVALLYVAVLAFAAGVVVMWKAEEVGGLVNKVHSKLKKLFEN